MSAGRYIALLRQRPIGALFAASLVARLPWGMTSLALILLVTSHGGSYARAGLVSAVYTVGSGVAGPLVGRLVDAFGRRTVVPPLSLAWTGLLAAVWWAAGRPVGLLLVTAALAGLCAPPIAAVVRAMWPVLLDGAPLRTMYALDATFQELAFVAGPALVAGVTAGAGPGAALLLAGGLGAAGLIAFSAHPAAAGERRREAGARLAMRSEPRLVMLLVAGLLLVCGLSACDVAVVATVGGRSHAGTAGLLYALWSAGSMIGGLIWGGRVRATTPLAPLVALAAVHLASLAAAPGPVVLAVLLFVGGASIAPALGGLYGHVGSAVPSEVATEAFGWLSSAFVAGGALGNAASGAVLTWAGPHASFGLAGGAGALAIVAALVADRVPAPDPVPEAAQPSGPAR
ncbi:MAG TPA: MFS transporter [Acidimicrobiales bacterium]|nr:MFS transporter [Acidimicrobiales bacterium]